MITTHPTHPTPGSGSMTHTTGGLLAQIERLVARGVPAAIGQSPEAFRQALLPLGMHLQGEAGEPDIEAGVAHALLVIHSPRFPTSAMWPRVQREGRSAMERLFPKKPEDFQPTQGLGLPAGEAYLLLGLERGNDTLGAVPADAAKRLAEQGRSPLTIEEGTCLLLQWPHFLKPNHCFMMLGSRCGDRRVPAWWLSGRSPRLGWCWEGNPHTWLGFASCLRRSPAVDFGGVD